MIQKRFVFFSFLLFSFSISRVFGLPDVDGLEGRTCLPVNRSMLPKPCDSLFTQFSASLSQEDLDHQYSDTQFFIDTVNEALPDDNSTLGRCKIPLITSICFDPLFSNCKGDDCR